MTNDKPELSSEELLRQAREALGPPPDLVQSGADDLADRPTPAAAPTTDDLLAPPTGPSIDDLLATPLPPLPSLAGSDVPLPDAGTVRGGARLPGSAVPDPPKAWSPEPSAPPVSPPAPPAGASTEYYPAEPFRPQSYGAPLQPPPPNAASAATTPPPPMTSTSGPEYYPTEPLRPQSFGVERPSHAPGLGTPAPPASLGMWQQGSPLSPPPKRTRNISWGPVIAILVVGVLGLIGWVVGAGSTSASRLGVGDCFEDPGLGDFTRVTNQSCGELHDIQVFARLDNVPTGLIESIDDPNGAGTLCENKLLLVLSSGHMQDPTIVIPDDAIMGWLSDPDTASRGDVLCTIESPSGSLFGSVLP